LRSSLFNAPASVLVPDRAADDLDLVQVLERVVLEIDELAADDEMEQLLLRGTIWHEVSS
jgi:hypothetical protein